MRTAAALDVHFPANEAIVARVTARLDDFEPSAIHEIGPESAPLWRVFFASGSVRDAALDALGFDFAGTGLEVRPVDVPDEDWAARSQASLTAVRVGRLVVAPPWAVTSSRLPDPTGSYGASGSGREAHDVESDLLVVIQPSMGFGTGHHETTRLCLALLQEARVAGRDVLDVGTGSGVLAIAAALLGARTVRAIDVDDDALESARENVALNDAALAFGGVRPVIETGNLRTGVSTADLVVANLTGGLLQSAADPLLAAVRAEGQLLISGFQPHEADAVLAALAPEGSTIERRREGEWEAALITRGTGGLGSD